MIKKVMKENLKVNKRVETYQVKTMGKTLLIMLKDTYLSNINVEKFMQII